MKFLCDKGYNNNLVLANDKMSITYSMLRSDNYYSVNITPR